MIIVLPCYCLWYLFKINSFYFLSSIYRTIIYFHLWIHPWIHFHLFMQMFRLLDIFRFMNVFCSNCLICLYECVVNNFLNKQEELVINCSGRSKISLIPSTIFLRRTTVNHNTTPWSPTLSPRQPQVPAAVLTINVIFLARARFCSPRG